MKKYILNIVAVVSILSTFSCTAPIDIKTDSSDPVLSVYGLLNNEVKRHEVIISSSLPYFENKPAEKITGASVKIKSSQGEEFIMIDDSIKGHYRMAVPMAAVPGVTYNLEISADLKGDGDIKKYSASTIMPHYLQIDSIQVKPVKVMGNTLNVVYFYAPNPKNHVYILPKFSINDTLKSIYLSQYGAFENKLAQGDYAAGIWIYDFNDYVDWDKFKEEDRKRLIFSKKGDKITAHMNIINKNYYDFIDQAQDELRGENPLFGGPASNILSNIAGGVGFFTAMYTVDVETIGK